ncbi:MAG TPA: polyprenyl diphosphate synthase, partial [Rhodothermales bacterium]|nr:polyprenyl diphosphate synthase [Rhodothermales bacterium]
IHTIRRERKTLDDNNIRLQAIGNLDKLPKKARAELQDALDATADNTRMTLVLALSYSGRWEITEAVRTLARRVQQGDLDPDAIDETVVAQALNASALPDPDLLIRTGGEYRVSNFLLWQLAYTEMFITEDFWPAFRRDQLYEAVRAFQNRERRFGRVKG